MLWVGLPIADLRAESVSGRTARKRVIGLLPVVGIRQIGALRIRYAQAQDFRCLPWNFGLAHNLLSIAFEIHVSDQTNRTQIPCERPPSYEQDSPGAQPALPLVVCASAPPGGPPAVDARSKVAQAGVAHAFRGM